MKSNKFSPKKNVAQAMVEFAIVLPILLLLLYGLLEAGRLLFIYSSVVTASRQAARYGSTTGQGVNWGPSGPNNSTVYRYNDCYGIKQAARKADFLKAIADITISFDNPSGTCSGNTGGFTASNTNESRIIVTVRGRFTSLVPKIVPFFDRDIIATSRRTILVKVTIPVAGGGGGGGGGGAAATSVNVTTSTNPSEPGQIFTATATVSSGSGVPTGKVTFSVDGTPVSSTCTLKNLTAGTATCSLSLTETKTIVVSYQSDNASAYQDSSGSVVQTVGPANTVTTITVVSPEPSVVGQTVTVTVAVTNAYGSGPIPTGQVSVTTHNKSGTCVIALDPSGQGSCNVGTYGNSGLGWSPIDAVYIPGDTKHLGSNAATYQHEVLSQPATALPPPTDIPPTVVTPVPPPVTGCNTIAQSVASINWASKTMSITLTNNTNYAVTIRSVFVAWNYASGHNGADTSLWLQKVDLGGTVFWQDTTGLNQPSALLPLSTAVVIPANSAPKLTFTFDKTYNNKSGEQIQVQFLTPGCESYPVIMPAGAATITPAPSGNLKIQLISGGSDNLQESQFWYHVQNTGSSAISNISVRLYFTLDGSNPASNYTLVSNWDQSGAAVITGPTLVSGSIYYFTINYGTASLAVGSVWQFNGQLHLSNWNNTYVSTNDWWHTSAPMPTTYTDWPTIPAYVNGAIVWGSQP